MSEYTFGVDLGQSFDPTAIAVVGKLRPRVGDPIYQVGHLERLPMQTKGMSPYGVSITCGTADTKNRCHYSVPKLALISTVQALLHDGRLKIHKDLADVQTLVAELQDFRAEVTDSG